MRKQYETSSVQVKMLVTEMEEVGINLVTLSETSSIAVDADGLKTLELTNGKSVGGYDEVLFAIGRQPVTGSTGG